MNIYCKIPLSYLTSAGKGILNVKLWYYVCTSIITEEGKHRNNEGGKQCMPMKIQVPQRTLLVLCGPAGCGKSTFAAQRFVPTSIVSSDYCRAMICDDVTNQQVNRDTFDLFYYIIRKRIFLGRFTVADSTALHAYARHQLRELAQDYGYATCLLIFDIPAAICLQHDLQRERRVGEAVIRYHAGLLKQALLDAPNEGWQQVHVLQEADMNAVVEVVL